MKSGLNNFSLFIRDKIELLLCTIVLIILCHNNILYSQISRYGFGLDGMNVNDIKYYNGYLFAATDTGVYSKDALDFASTWIHIGLENKKVNAIYPHDFGPVSWTVTAGVSPKFVEGDSALIYCSCDSNWIIADTGINRSELQAVKVLDGFPSPVICGETFAGGNGKLYVRGINTRYEEIFNIGGYYILNVIKTDLRTGNVWIGGETGYFQPFIAKSEDKGINWDINYLNLGGDNACNSIEFDPEDTNIVYAGMEGMVIKTTDGGISWDSTGLVDAPYYFFGLSFDHQLDRLYAGGFDNQNKFGLYFSEDGGKNWIKVRTYEEYSGIKKIIFAPTPLSYVSTIYIATLGDGVLWSQPLLPGVGDKKNMIGEFSLLQNFPNPFNPVTKIEWLTRIGSWQTLKVYDFLGREVATLVDEYRPAGKYETEFDAANLSSGVYMYRMVVENYSETRKMILLR